MDINSTRWPGVEVMHLALGHAGEALNDVMEALEEVEELGLRNEERSQEVHDVLNKCEHLLQTVLWTAISIIRNMSVRRTYIMKARESVQHFQNEV